MKTFNPQEIERLFSELEQYGYVFPSCVRWHIDDIKIQAEDTGIDLSEKSDDELAEILREILSANSDWIMGDINNAIFDGIKELEL
jgi:DUF438 domain-containing protein